MDYNILNVFMSATLVAKCIMLLLICLSILSWTIIISKSFSLSRANSKANRGLEAFSKAADIRTAVQTVAKDSASPLFPITQNGVNEFNNSREAGIDENGVVETVNRALQQGVAHELDRLHSSLSFLATTGNAAPFIGLFGTVWGIMVSFHAIGQMKSASLATVAPGISEALISTALGLAVAIPATVAYNAFLGKLSGIETKLVNFAGVFLNKVQREVNVRRHAHNA